MLTIKKILDGYSKIEEVLIAALLILATLCCCYEVLMRYVFLAPTKWTEEFIRYMAEWLVFLGISAASRNPHDLINFDLFYSRMSDKTKAIVDTLIYLIISVLAIIILKSSISWIINIYTLGGVSTAMRFPNWLPRLIIPISFALLTIRYVLHLIEQLLVMAKVFKA